MIRVLLVDDQALFCEGLRTLLDLQPDIEVVGETNNVREAIECVARAAPGRGADGYANAGVGWRCRYTRYPCQSPEYAGDCVNHVR